MLNSLHFSKTWRSAKSWSVVDLPDWKRQRDREHVRTTKMNLRRKKRTLTVNQTLSKNFSLDELETALMSLKPGKTAGFDGIYPRCTD
jgi:hypothetical protein